MCTQSRVFECGVLLCFSAFTVDLDELFIMRRELLDQGVCTLVSSSAAIALPTQRCSCKLYVSLISAALQRQGGGRLPR